MGDNIFVLIHHAIQFFSLWAHTLNDWVELKDWTQLGPKKKIYIDKGFSIKAVYLHNYLVE